MADHDFSLTESSLSATSLSATSVRHPLWQGTVPVAAIWFPAGWYPEAERARRVLQQWRAGASLTRFAEGDLLRFPEPIAMSCDELGGWPLCRQGRGLSSAPLSAAELAAAPTADFWLVEGGQARGWSLSQGNPINPSRWLAVEAYALLDTYDCSAVVAPVVELVPADARELRDVLNGKIAPPSDEQRDFLKAMSERAARAAPSAEAARRLQRPRAQEPAPPDGRNRVRDLLRLARAVFLLGLVLYIIGRGLSGVEVGHAWLVLLMALCVVLVILASVLAVARWLRRGWTWLLGWPARAVAAAARGAGGSAPAGAAAGTDARGDAGSGAGSGAASRPGKGPAGASDGGAGDLPSRRPPSPPQRWRDWLARWAVTTQLARFMGRRQAAYLRKTMELFESGRLEEALRHAIPLGGDGDSLGQAFGAPTPRQDLSLSRGRTAGPSIDPGLDATNYLRRLYRQSFERLDREGRIDEAVFVLAELLESRTEALDYLEKHQRFAQAAELSLAWDSPPAVIVRLHALAGDWRKALAVARRDRAFADAVVLLEKRWPDAAARLREEWARHLAAQGDWLQAVEVIWPIPALHTQAADWLLSAEAAGGGLGAAALVKRAVLWPDTLKHDAERLQALRDDPELHVERHAMAQSLLAMKTWPEAAARLARLINPGLLADHAAGQLTLSRSDLERMLSRAGDACFDADAPLAQLVSPQIKPLASRGELLAGQPPEAGALGIHDAALLDDGCCLVALGESGAAVVDRRGRWVARFAVPAYRIVIADSRRVALVMAPRDRLWRVTRLELTSRRAIDLGVADLGHVATEFDGVAWTVLAGTRLRVLDTQHSLQEVLWQVSDLPGTALGLTVQSDLEQVALVNGDGAVELWSYQLPRRRLLSRGDVMGPMPADECLRILNPAGGVIDLWCEADEAGQAVLRHRKNGALAASLSLVGIPLSEVRRLHARAASGWLVVGIEAGSLVHWKLIAMVTRDQHAEVSWPAASRPRCRVQAGHVMLFDDHGRFWAVDTQRPLPIGWSLRP
ncbi:bpX6 domain-containing protein [Ideonella sp. DXS29W]|uniref:BpX6 domain-containing protein n=1 Tax=Ideonella lacteola TaxID=2984193 RepID=A0ABU9BII0_9BURK